MSNTIKKVGVIGASGNLGTPLVKELLASGFDVTALTRETSTATFPAGVRVQKVDYESPEALREALTGLDAVVSTIATAATGGQEILVDAAAAAGVKRFVPSEFGVNTQTLGDHPISALLAGKTRLIGYLKQKSGEAKGFSWTGVQTGMFFDWCLQNGALGFDLKTRKATIFDSGNEKFQTSTLAQSARAVAGALKHADATTDKYLGVRSFNASQNEILAALEEATGAKWTVERAAAKDYLQKGTEALAQHDFGNAFLALLWSLIAADGAGRAVSEEGNKLVGIQDEDLKSVVKEVVDRLG